MKKISWGSRGLPPLAGLGRAQVCQKAFTLIELVVALALLSLVMLGTYAAVRQVRASAQAVQASIQEDDLAAQSMSLFSSLIQSCFFKPQHEDLAFVGQSVSRDAEAHDSLSFTTMSGFAAASDSPSGAPVPVRLSLIQPERGRHLLLLAIRPHTDARLSGPTFVLSSDVDGLDFSFLTPDGWQENYDSSVWKGLPTAVRVNVFSKGQLLASRVFALALSEAYPAEKAEP